MILGMKLVGLSPKSMLFLDDCSCAIFPCFVSLVFCVYSCKTSVFNQDCDSIAGRLY